MTFHLSGFYSSVCFLFFYCLWNFQSAVSSAFGRRQHDALLLVPKETEVLESFDPRQSEFTVLKSSHFFCAVVFELVNREIDSLLIFHMHAHVNVLFHFFTASKQIKKIHIIFAFKFLSMEAQINLIFGGIWFQSSQ